MTTKDQMLDRDLHRRGISGRTIGAMAAVPREEFVRPEHRQWAYRDTPLPFYERQTISQPYIVALMADLAQLELGGRVLEVGAGSGYAAAVFSHLCGEVHTVERNKRLADSARERLNRLGYADKVHVHHGDGIEGLAAHAPFTAILVAAATMDIPHVWHEQLAVGGRLVVPYIRGPRTEQLIVDRKVGPDQFEVTRNIHVHFVPLTEGVE